MSEIESAMAPIKRPELDLPTRHDDRLLECG